jgi:hypothetical protein
MKLVPRAAVAGTRLEETFEFATRAGFAGDQAARPWRRPVPRAPALRAASWGMFSQRLAPFTPPRQPRKGRKVLLKALEVLSEHAARESV